MMNHGLTQPEDRTETDSQNRNADGVTESLGRISDMVDAAEANSTESSIRETEKQLALARLGVSNGLFVALQAKHAPTASHCLRVALTCSAWANAIQLPQSIRDLLEVGALLHDVGKIGVPDAVLFKPGRLEREEIAQLDQYRQFTLQILGASGAKRELIDAVFYASGWYDGSRPGYPLVGDQLPVASRMLSIVDAFDSITTDQVHRQGQTVDAAIAELHRHSNTQFDASFVNSFADLIAKTSHAQQMESANRWLQQIAEGGAEDLWSRSSVVTRVSGFAEADFYRQLVQSMQDAVVFVDAQGRITAWNRATERLTGIRASAAKHRQFVPKMIKLRNEAGDNLDEKTCPIRAAIESGESVSMAGQVSCRENKTSAIRLHVSPVYGNDRCVDGAVVVITDFSQELTLTKRVEELNLRVAVDPLTKVANRAEIDRVHSELVIAASESNENLSLIICDIDFFKRINDDFGHQAGDEALMVFAAMLKRHREQGDLVGRFGGEEFVIICPECDLVGAAERAEEIRTELETMRVPALDHKSMTASFGVTQLQPGDTPDTMLRRADRALIQAKETGRNRVVQIGFQATTAKTSVETPSKTLLGWLKGGRTTTMSESTLITTVPIDIAVEKFRGFVSDQGAQVVRVDANKVNIKVDGKSLGLQRRRSDRSVPFLVDLEFVEVAEAIEDLPETYRSGTLIRLDIHPIRSRDRRRKDLEEQIRTLVASLRSYFMAIDLEELHTKTIDRAATRPGEGREE